ncbi:hypothetical protein [Streptomyces sp. NBC_01092]|uniref:hypothetical protein n=1 Tax=Streptomyces sp. NBC_01092 TaxID=2903748 RepID=UPI0038642955|nr:hypothetical protein OG254_42925 [Streptomyces sp. NBC_01092]
MHKLRKAAVVVVALGSAGLLSTGTAAAHGNDDHGGKGGGHYSVLQSSNCKSHDLNLNILGQVGILNGLLGNALNGEGDAGAQKTHQGSTMGCNNSAF